ncbi:MAG: hypothetical protein HY698_04695 [Deltaproteobacteria bacterium]|nr:hypothetical protein [Deltaproteobacteria bacterium]
MQDTAIETRDASKLDTLAEVLLRTQFLSVNINSMQIVVVGRGLDHELLVKAIRATISRCPLLLTRPDPKARRVEVGAWKPEDIRCDEAHHTGPLGFRHPEFRRFVTELALKNPVKWLEEPPVRFWHVRSTIEDKSCLLMTPSHAVADAKSDSMFLSELFSDYGRLLGQEDADGKRLGFESLPSVSPTCRQIDRGALSGIGMWESIKEGLAKDHGLRVQSQHVRGTSGRTVDFYREILDENLQKRFETAARREGQTVNTLLTACLLRAVKDQVAGKEKRIRVMMPVSVRNLVPERAKTYYQNFMLPYRMSLPRHSSDEVLFEDIARQVSDLKAGRIFLELAKLGHLNRLLRNRSTRRLGLWMFRRFQTTSIAYSNPGVVEERFTHFGHPGLPIEDYIGFGCLVAPIDFIFYTPKIHGRLELNAVYYPDAFDDFKEQVIDRIKRELIRITDKHAPDYDVARAA